MTYCYKCGKEVKKTGNFCPNCGTKVSKKNSNGALGYIFALLALGGVVIGLFLLIGGAVATLMNPIIENTSAGGHVWAIGYLIWSFFYPTGLINSCYLVGVISLGIGVGSFLYFQKS